MRTAGGRPLAWSAGSGSCPPHPLAGGVGSVEPGDGAGPHARSIDRHPSLGHQRPGLASALDSGSSTSRISSPSSGGPGQVSSMEAGSLIVPVRATTITPCGRPSFGRRDGVGPERTRPPTASSVEPRDVDSVGPRRRASKSQSGQPWPHPPARQSTCDEPWPPSSGSRTPPSLTSSSRSVEAVRSSHDGGTARRGEGLEAAVTPLVHDVWTADRGGRQGGARSWRTSTGG